MLSGSRGGRRYTGEGGGLKPSRTLWPWQLDGGGETHYFGAPHAARPPARRGWTLLPGRRVPHGLAHADSDTEGPQLLALTSPCESLTFSGAISAVGLY